MDFIVFFWKWCDTIYSNFNKSLLPMTVFLQKMKCHENRQETFSTTEEVNGTDSYMIYTEEIYNSFYYLYSFSIKWCDLLATPCVYCSGVLKWKRFEFLQLRCEWYKDFITKKIIKENHATSVPDSKYKV